MNSESVVLVVDDCLTMRRIIINLLKGLGFRNIFEAGSGHAAVGILQERKVDLILCDLNMPDMNGLDFLKWLRCNEAVKSTVFVMVTAEGRKGFLIDIMKAGANSYILKPFTESVFIEKLRRIFPF